jgi:argininosuccinate synthase
MGCRLLQYTTSTNLSNTEVADVGQEEDFAAAKKKALQIGAVAVYVEVQPCEKASFG